MQTFYRNSGRKNLLQLFRIHHYTLKCNLFFFFNHRTDDIHLPSFFNLIFHKTVRLWAVIGPHDTVFDGQTVGRKFVHDGQIHISIQYKGKRPWNRRRTHRKDMRCISFFHQFFPLPHPKTVLFICDDKGKIRKFHIILQYRMSSHDNIPFAFCQFLLSFPLFFGCHRADQEPDLYSIWGKHFFQGLLMLHRKHFCRHHKGSLLSIAYGKK